MCWATLHSEVQTLFVHACSSSPKECIEYVMFDSADLEEEAATKIQDAWRCSQKRTSRQGGKIHSPEQYVIYDEADMFEAAARIQRGWTAYREVRNEMVSLISSDIVSDLSQWLDNLETELAAPGSNAQAEPLKVSDNTEPQDVNRPCRDLDMNML